MLPLGIKGYLQCAVDKSMTAQTYGSGTLEVLATPAMIALVEKAAWTSIANAFDEGHGTVGSFIEIKHLAPTPIGRIITIHTELIEIHDRTLLFNVTVHDSKGIIGVGSHGRVVVENKRFLEKANLR